jgi:hypothetical protein
MAPGPVKVGCNYVVPQETQENQTALPVRPLDWEGHPSWITGMEALKGYSDWINSVVLPVAFQWIEEHKKEVYATVPPEYTDDVGVVMEAAFKLVQQRPAYKVGQAMSTTYEAAIAAGTWDASTTNPVWTGLVKKIRTETKQAFAEKSDLIGDIPK